MRKYHGLFFMLVVLLPFVASAAEPSAGKASVMASEYTVDKAHSSVGFAVRHMMVSTTTGGFDDIDGNVRFDPADLPGSVFETVIQVKSINTRNPQRDDHLRGADFFDAEKYPLITFKSKKIVKVEGEGYLLTGDLTMKAVTKEIEVPVLVSGPVANPMNGRMALGLEARFSVNRQDYGVNWNKTLDNGGVMVGDMVDVNISVELAGK